MAYAIGVAHPLSVLVDTFGTEAEGLTQERIEELVREHFDLRPAAILRDLDLRRPIYEKTAAYGHFGRDDRDFTWERTDKADALRPPRGWTVPRLPGRRLGRSRPRAGQRVTTRRGIAPLDRPHGQTDDLQKTLIAALQRNRGELDPARLAEVLRRLAATA